MSPKEIKNHIDNLSITLIVEHLDRAEIKVDDKDTFGDLKAILYDKVIRKVIKLRSNEWCYYIDACGNRDGKGFIPSMVTANETGHTPMSGRGEHSVPWYWGTDYVKACEICRNKNEGMGISSEREHLIVSSSMFYPRSPLYIEVEDD